MTAPPLELIFIVSGRQEGESWLDFLDRNRSYLHSICNDEADQFFDAHLGAHLMKRVTRPAALELSLKAKVKKAYENRQRYVMQRRHDFSVSQQRVGELIAKLRCEYEPDVREYLGRYSNSVTRTRQATAALIGNTTGLVSRRVCDAALELSAISDALSVTAAFYARAVPHVHAAGGAVLPPGGRSVLARATACARVLRAQVHGRCGWTRRACS
jgi:hypothetical protein